MAKKYTKKPITVEAVQYTGENEAEVTAFTNRHACESAFYKCMTMPGPDGDYFIYAGDFVIKGVEGELYPCKPSAFHKTYSEAK